MLTVVEPAKSYDLTTLASVKQELGIDGRESDLLIKRYISQASATVAKYCNRVFAAETVAEMFYRGVRFQELMLSRYPIKSIVSVVEAGSSLVEADYVIDLQTGLIERRSGGRASWWQTGQTVVTYQSGYDIADLPESIERATIQLVKQYLASGDRDPLIRSEAIEGAGSTEYFSGGATGFGPEIAGLLQSHMEPNA